MTQGAKRTPIDVAIIGAGPAGCAAGLELARAGRSVLILEKKSFPRDKVCGGCLSGWAVNQLERLLGSTNVLPGVPGTHITFRVGGRQARCRSDGKTRVVNRSLLDAGLADAAAKAGADIRHGVAARLIPTAGGWDIGAGETRLAPETILVASGAQGGGKTFFSRSPFGPAMIGLQWLQPLAGTPLQAGDVEMHWLRGGYVGVAAPDAAHCIVALALRTTNLVHRNPMEFLRDMNPGARIWDFVSPPPRGGRARGAAGFPAASDRLGDKNLLFIGDAAACCEPFSGAGIALALYSATGAVRSILSAGDVQAAYAASMRLHRRMLWRTRAISMVLNSRLGARLAGARTGGVERWMVKVMEMLHIRGTP